MRACIGHWQCACMHACVYNYTTISKTVRCMPVTCMPCKPSALLADTWQTVTVQDCNKVVPPCAKFQHEGCYYAGTHHKRSACCVGILWAKSLGQAALEWCGKQCTKRPVCTTPAKPFLKCPRRGAAPPAICSKSRQRWMPCSSWDPVWMQSSCRYRSTGMSVASFSEFTGLFAEAENLSQ